MAKEIETDTKTNRVNTVHLSRNWAYGLGAVLLLLVVFMAGVGVANHHRMRNNIGLAGGYAARFAGPGHRKMMAGDFRTNSGDRTSGVVTAVNGSSFTLAGHGATTNVVTNSSTQYRGGNTVKQNDSVLVFGTTSGGTLTATQIVINP
jgi:hypothetical protein